VGQIAAVLATSHVLFPPQGVEAAAERVFEGMLGIGRRIRAAEPDVLVIVTSDHLMNLNLNLQPPFVIGVADSYIPYGDMGVPTDPFPGHRAFAEGFVGFASDTGFDLARADEIRPDHGVAIPHLFVDRAGHLPTVPLLVNVTMDAPPAPKRCWQLGKVLRRYVQEIRPATERVAVLAAGGLSHWVGVKEQGQINEVFDRIVLDLLARGQVETLASMKGEVLLKEAGNGGVEICNWILAGGTAGDCGGEALFYEPIGAWMTGLGGFAFHEKGHRAS